MKILVTGGAGFIGSHLVDSFIAMGHEVCIIDNMIHGKEKNINKKAIVYKIDIRDEKILQAFQMFKPEIVVHDAAQISVPKSIEIPMEDASINILGSINVLEASRKVGVRKIIYPASAAIFGQPVYLPIDEKHPLNMISGYGITKHTVEHYLQMYKSLYNIDYAVLRYSNVYGARQDSTGEGGVISIFCEKIMNNSSPYIFGDGEQLRDFIYVKDVVRANIAAIDSINNGIYNVCTSRKTSVNELLKIINDITGKNISPIYTDEREGDIKDSYMTYEKIKNEIGWEPEYDLYDGIKETIKSFKIRRGKNEQFKQISVLQSLQFNS
jgi:UDP-glucose 4-epimerase